MHRDKERIPRTERDSERARTTELRERPKVRHANVHLADMKMRRGSEWMWIQEGRICGREKDHALRSVNLPEKCVAERVVVSATDRISPDEEDVSRALFATNLRRRKLSR
jgi:hypothetical protein